MTVKLKGSDGAWKDIASMYLKNSSGVWKGLSSAYLKVSGSWKLLFSQTAPSIQSPVTISSSSGTHPSVLTGRNYHWYNVSANPKYLFQKSEDGSTWTDIGTLTTIANPSVGLSNTVTYTTQTSDFTQTMMYFRFIVVGVNSVGTTTQSASSSVTVSLYVAPPPTTPPPTTPPPTTPPPTTPPPILTGLTPIISNGVYVTASSVKFSVTNYNSAYTWAATSYTPSGNLISYTITSSVISASQIDYTISGISQSGVTIRVTTSRSGYTTEYAEKPYTFPSNQVTGVTPSDGASNGTGRRLSLSWTNVSGITRYMLQFAPDGTFSWTYAYNISNPYTSNFYYTYGSTFKMYVYGTDSNDNIINGSQSELTYWTPQAPAPPPPTTPPPTTPPPTTPPPTTPPPTTPPPTTPPPTTPPPTTPPPTTPPPTTPPPAVCPTVSAVRRCTAANAAGNCCQPTALSGCGGSGAVSFSC